MILDPETRLVIEAMRLYVAQQREHRAIEDGLHNKEGFSAVYAALNKLGYLDKSP